MKGVSQERIQQHRRTGSLGRGRREGRNQSSQHCSRVQDQAQRSRRFGHLQNSIMRSRLQSEVWDRLL